MPAPSKKPSEKRAEARTRRRQGEPNRFLSFFESSRLIASTLFLLLAGLITVICFWNPPTRSTSVAVGQVAMESIVANFHFHYESKIETERQRSVLRLRVPPTLAPIPNIVDKFEQTITSLDQALVDEEKKLAKAPPLPSPEPVPVPVPGTEAEPSTPPKPGTPPQPKDFPPTPGDLVPPTPETSPHNVPQDKPEQNPEAPGNLAQSPSLEPENQSSNLPAEILQVLANPRYSKFPAPLLKDLVLKTNQEERTDYFTRCIHILHEIHSHPILPQQNEFLASSDPSSLSLFSILPQGTGSPDDPNRKTVLTLASAQNLFSFRIRQDQEIPMDLRDTLIGISSVAIVPNLRYDAAAHRLKIQNLEASTPAIIITVNQNEVILRAGEEITKADFEKYDAYLKEERQQGYTAKDSLKIVLRGLFIASILIGIIWFCLKIGYRRISGRNRMLGLAALVIVTNLLLIRFILQLVEIPSFQTHDQYLTLLPYLCPTAFAPLILAILSGSTLAILGAFVISLLFSFMLEGSMEIFLASFCATLAGVYLCRNISQRSRLMQASLATGAINALLALFIGLISDTKFDLIGIQALACFTVSAITGMLVIGILPILENTFKFITDIRLLELTDTNHPLLRRLQMEAPGTYHHSLMVANLSENAARQLGANPLKCRACALFHDVGKLAKPEYFIENQIPGNNPHHSQNPSMSALIIKSHIPEGVELAKEHKLPRDIIDVIRQHHGTGLIHYFYRQAIKQAVDPSVQNDQHPDETQAPLLPEEEVEESTYRYPGPKPQFRESAIIFFADAIEAASRSLHKLNAQSLEELIDTIFEDRLEDGQLDDTPLTFQEIAEIKKSFTFTLLNMAHARTKYPGFGEGKDIKGKKENRPFLPAEQTLKVTSTPFPTENPGNQPKNQTVGKLAGSKNQ